jgi:phage terminase large subunit-like protein
MPWQRQVCDVALEVDADGRLAYRTVIITVPRQSGKTTLILPVMVHRALAFGEPQRLVYTAQSLKDARKKWRDDHVDKLDRSPLSDLYHVRKSHGDEAIVWHNGSVHMLASTTEKAGHGETLDFGAIDEAFSLPDDRVEAAIRPAMITRPNAQLWIFSTQGTDASTFLNEKVKLGRDAVESGRTSGICYFEWAAPAGSALDDPTAWSFHPAVGFTQSAETLMTEALAMPQEEAERAFFNWAKLGSEAESKLPMVAWYSREDESSEISDRLVLAVDVSTDREWASVGVAGRRPDGVSWHGEVVEHRPKTSWVARRVAELVSAHDVTHPVVLDASGPAGSLIAELEDEGLSVDRVSVQGQAAACGLLYDLVSASEPPEGFWHLGQGDLDFSVRKAPVQVLSSGAWRWAPSDEVDISPLRAVTFALGAAVGASVEPKRPTFAF